MFNFALGMKYINFLALYTEQIVTINLQSKAQHEVNVLEKNCTNN